MSSDMSVADRLLSGLVSYRTYAKFIPELSRRESPSETIERNMQMHIDKFPKLQDEIVKVYGYVSEGMVLPSMRSFQFGGIAAQRNNVRIYNCAYHNVDHTRAFGETLFLLLSGTGVGYSIQRHHIKLLPRVHKPLESQYYPIHDSIEGWAMAVDALMEAYFLRKPEPAFDYAFIREEGALLKTSGGRAPGPAKLKEMLELVKSQLDKAIGRKLTSLEVHDLICIISDCVRAGGVRESALIALFDRDDMDMLRCKSGSWWEAAPWRARANNSAVLPRDEVEFNEFSYIYETLQGNGTGEPGFYWTNNKWDWGTNPCVELAIRNNQFCNLTTINQATVRSLSDLVNRARAAAFLGTLQASYTDFPYLNPSWQTTTENEALIGVSFTGIADAPGRVSRSDLQKAAREVVQENQRVAHLLGINAAARCTVGKPEGSSSAYLGTSSGIHARPADSWYLRRVRLKSSTPLVKYLETVVPGLLEQSQRDDNIIISIPQKSPDGAISQDKETALDVFGRAMEYNTNWIQPGHVSGTNRNNISCTINMKEHDWDVLKMPMWDNRHIYNGLSLFPHDGGSYVQAPFEPCTESTYNEYMAKVSSVDFTKIVETYDMTSQNQTAACAGGACEFK